MLDPRSAIGASARPSAARNRPAIVTTSRTGPAPESERAAGLAVTALVKADHREAERDRRAGEIVVALLGGVGAVDDDDRRHAEPAVAGAGATA